MRRLSDVAESVLVRLSRRCADSAWFRHGITIAIILNATVFALETWQTLVERFGSWLELAHDVFLGIFVVETLIKLCAHFPRIQRYFRDGWNAFDFSIVVVSLIPESAHLSTVFRLARLLRVLRLLSTLPELRVLVSTVVRSIPSMFNIMILMGIIFFVYAVAGYHLFHEIDPTHWGHLGIALLTLFRVVTLEGWTDVMYSVMEVHWWGWAYFVSFVIIGSFVVINLIIAILINHLDQATREGGTLEQATTHDELLTELKRTQADLTRVARQLEGMKERA